MREELLVEIRPGVWEFIGHALSINSDYKPYQHGLPYSIEVEFVPSDAKSMDWLHRDMKTGAIKDYRLGNSTIHALVMQYQSKNGSYYDGIGSPLINLTLHVVDQSITSDAGIRSAMQKIKYVVDLVKTMPIHRQQFSGLLVDAMKTQENVVYAGVTFSIEQAQEILDGSFEEFRQQHNGTVRR